MNSTAGTAGKTPGYNCRLSIWFDTDRNGRRIAYRWSHGRAIRISLHDAEMFVAHRCVNVLDGHPMRPAR